MTSRDLRVPFFLVAIFVMFVVFALETGAHWLLPSATTSASQSVQSQLGIPSLWLLDIALLWNLVLMGIQLLPDKPLVGRVQGIVTLVLSIVVIFAGLKMLLESFVALMIMLALVSSFFGWLIYVPLFAFFNTGAASVVLSALTFLKLVVVVLLLVAQQGFLKVKGLVVLFALSLVCDLLLAFLIAFPPGILASITDAIGAVVVSIVAIVYAVFQAVWAIYAIVLAIRSVVTTKPRTGMGRSSSA